MDSGMSGKTKGGFNPFVDETHEVLAPGHTFSTISSRISDVVLTPKIKPGWVLALLGGFALLNVFLVTVVTLLANGIGIFGNNIPVAWAAPIINFVWWIGIGHAGTLISAILLLLRQNWRTSINRFAEAMTLFAVACAGLFPILHLGRPWLFFWLMPYPNVMNLWPQFRSPLNWDVFAVSTYANCSLIFWYIGLIPDLALLRDKAKSTPVRMIYGMLALGWRGSAIHWHRYEMAYLLLAGLATPLVVSVHTIVSFDFAMSQVPGWHSTIFPPYFVAGAIYAGFAMVLTLMIPLRKIYGLRDFVTMRHIDVMAKVMLATGLIVAYGYLMEGFTAWYSGSMVERYSLLENRFFGPYGKTYMALLFCNVVVPQILWVPKIRHNIFIVFLVAMAVNVGMWLERFIIIAQSLSRDWLPSSWGHYSLTFWDFTMFFGSIGLFLCLLFLFIRVLPMIAIAEVKTMLPESGHGHQGGH